MTHDVVGVPRSDIVLQVARVVRIRLADLHDSYRYNPFVQAEVDAAWRIHEVKSNGITIRKSEKNHDD